MKPTVKKSLLVKKPFTRITTGGYGKHGADIIGRTTLEVPYNDVIVRQRVTQQDFLRELDPLGHLVYNKEYYPDIWRQDPDSGKWYIEEVPRYAFSYQHIILTKHLTHLCGNDIVFELADKRDDEKARETLNTFKRGWAKHGMEIAWYNIARSVKATGDGAFVGYIANGKFGWKSLSFLDGDTLYPHYDRMTGKLILLAREYQGFDENGEPKTYVDVWDSKYFYCLTSGTVSKSEQGDVNVGTEEGTVAIPQDAELAQFDTSSYVCVEYRQHGFPMIPVAYHRDEEGACWSKSQEAIDNYEMAFSRLAQSNHDFGLPIMYVKGEGSEEISNEDMSNASKVIILPSDGEAGFLNRQDASNAYKSELDMLENMIYRMSFAVKTPELKSGDLPAAALKMLYSDAYENAMCDAQQYQGTIDTMMDIFIFGYGVESETRLELQNTPIRSYVEVYVHRNVAAEIVDMSSAVQNGYLSKQTASEKNYYSSPQEWSRILNEKHEADAHQLLLEEQRMDMQQDNTVETQEQLSEIQAAQQIAVAQAEAQIEEEDDEKARKVVGKKGSIATGRGAGRPARSGKVWDANGNFEGRNNWQRWNQTH